MSEQVRKIGDEVSYPTITITVADPDTGMTTTITGKAEVDISTIMPPLDVDLFEESVIHTVGRPSLRLTAHWVEQAGQHYTISREETS